MSTESGGYRKGCGCVLAVIGALIMACSIGFAVAMYCADEKAREENEAQWDVYNNNQSVIDSLYEAGVPDSLISERYPQPVIRQGGFATAFGVIGAIVGLIVGAIPFAIGMILWFVNGKKPLPPPEAFKKKF